MWYNYHRSKADDSQKTEIPRVMMLRTDMGWQNRIARCQSHFHMQFLNFAVISLFLIALLKPCLSFWGQARFRFLEKLCRKIWWCILCISFVRFYLDRIGKTRYNDNIVKEMQSRAKKYRAIPHKDCATDASSNFSSDETKSGVNTGCIHEHFCEIWREICKQMACKVARRSLCGIAIGAASDEVNK